MVCHRTLLELINGTIVPDSLTKWLSNYLSGSKPKRNLGAPCLHPVSYVQASPKVWLVVRLQSPERTVLATLDLSKAFDMVCHRTLLELINGTFVPDSLTKWLSIYLSGSKPKRNLGAPCLHPVSYVQASPKVLSSPTRSNFYLHDSPISSPEIKLQSYANNFHPFVQSRDIKHASNTLSNYLNTLHDYY